MFNEKERPFGSAVSYLMENHQLTQRIIASKVEVSETYLSDVLKKERNGFPVPKKLQRKLESIFKNELRTFIKRVTVTEERIINVLMERLVRAEVDLQIHRELLQLLIQPKVLKSLLSPEEYAKVVQYLRDLPKHRKEVAEWRLAAEQF